PQNQAIAFGGMNMFRRRIRFVRPARFRPFVGRRWGGRWTMGGAIIVAVLVGLCALMTVAAIIGPRLLARAR
ncbi:MAG TPA: hypothetical protein PLG23_08535, partial [Thermoflexales bacterium]|nr:hypothetical protein [Thermoflexales bacterium]